MPWLETSSVEQRERFIADERRHLYSRTELCARYGISRKTGYKWLDRYHEEGRRGLRERSHAPHHCPHRIAPAIAELLGGARRKHPDWGPGKLLDWLGPRHPEIADEAWPAVSTAGDLLAREGLVKKRRRRQPHQHPGVVAPVTHAPNDLWTTDFKGQFPTRDGVWCYPLTIGDQPTGPSFEGPVHAFVRPVLLRGGRVNALMLDAEAHPPDVELRDTANALKQYHIGLEEVDDGIWSIYFGTVLLAKVDERDMIIRD